MRKQETIEKINHLEDELKNAIAIRDRLKSLCDNDPMWYKYDIFIHKYHASSLVRDIRKKIYYFKNRLKSFQE